MTGSSRDEKTPDVQAFKEISIGGMSKDLLLRNLAEAGIRFNAYATVLFEHPSFSPEAPVERVRLVRRTLADLGLAIPCSYEAILARASALGLGLCPLHLGAFLRLEPLELPESTLLTVASPRPAGDERDPTGFYVRDYDGARWLRGYRAEGDAEWPVGVEFVFLD